MHYIIITSWAIYYYIHHMQYRAFGHFEKPLFIELCKHVETKFVPAGAILFRPGQVDDSIYVVRNGRLKVCIVEQVRGGRSAKSRYMHFYSPEIWVSCLEYGL